MLTSRQKKVATLIASLALSFSIEAGVFAQQSTSGPIPPPGLDQGLMPPSRTQVIIPGVPKYIWHHGCGPTAVGMVIGYWDSKGYPDLVPGDASSETQDVDAMIADDQGSPVCGTGEHNHYQDYSCPIDNSPSPLEPDLSELGGAHANNCVADFMHTSWSAFYNYYGWSWSSDVAPSYISYVNQTVPTAHPVAVEHMFDDFSWAQYKAEIDHNRPVVLLVDTDGNGGTDHFVPGIGYDDATMRYAVYNTWDMNIHWYYWRKLGLGSWSIFDVNTFDMIKICVDTDGDGYGNPGHPENECALDNCPSIANPLQEDMDSDGIGDVCDPDIDGDGVLNASDNCPLVSNSGQLNSDADSFGDVCDNCPLVINQDQWDEDDDNIGDWCDGKIHIHGENAPGGTKYVPYYYKVAYAGGLIPCDWSFVSGNLPNGCQFNGGYAGEIVGTPTVSATFVFKVAIRDYSIPPLVDTADVSILINEPPRSCGDADNNTYVNISDAVYLIAYIFSGGPAPNPLQYGDVNCDSTVNISDAVYLITYIFKGGAAPCAACK